MRQVRRPVVSSTLQSHWVAIGRPSGYRHQVRTTIIPLRNVVPGWSTEFTPQDNNLLIPSTCSHRFHMPCYAPPSFRLCSRKGISLFLVFFFAAYTCSSAKNSPCSHLLPSLHYWRNGADQTKRVRHEDTKNWWCGIVVITLVNNCTGNKWI